MSKRSLAQMIDSIPSTLPGTSKSDDLAGLEEADFGVANSCDEDSDLDEPAPIVVKDKKPTGYTRVGHGLSAIGKTNGEASAKREEPRKEVQAVIGKGGRTVYQQVSDPSKALYYAVYCKEEASDEEETWDGDAYIRVDGNRVSMLSETGGEPMGACALVGGVLPDAGSEMRIGALDVEVERRITYEEFRGATTILNNKSLKSIPAQYVPSTYAKPFKNPVQIKAARPPGGYIPAHTESSSSVAGPSRPAVAATTSATGIEEKSFYGKPAKKAEKIVIGEKSNKQRLEWGGALHDPNGEGAIVMDRPKEADAKRRCVLVGVGAHGSGTSIVDVVLDPLLAAKMRDHQRVGVKFMYKCVMGLTDAEANGCILADEMGLGKTLQTIALIYTLLSKSIPFAESSLLIHQNNLHIRTSLSIGKALIVCPVSLVDNWRKEFRKWIGPDRLTVIAADGSDAQLKAFTHHRGQHVLIIGYERLRKVIKQLASCQPPIDLIVCDEGHRLKSKDNKTTKMFEALRTTRRIILSGTPVQNDLSEYWAMVEFVCPGLLGTYSAFQKHYEKPILRGRQVGASKMLIEDSDMRMEELNTLSREFVLRRTADILSNYIPPKKEYVVFVAPSQLQLDVYASILNPGMIAAFSRNLGAQGLALIDLLRKVSNSPMLLRKKDEESSRAEEVVSATEAALDIIPRDISFQDVTISGKLHFLDRMLHDVHAKGDDKMVIVSNWTSTLNIIEGILKKKHYPFKRLDGSTPPKERQRLVDNFNREKKAESFVFLLSAKAGGTGLNLIGANRLVLFDSDWNPSTDLQAMARIHRDGQKKIVHIYRLLTTNTIDEKIYQRQITKTGLSEQMMDHHGQGGKENKDSFSPAELKDIFTLKLSTDGCQTHDLLGCDCEGKGANVLTERDSNLPTPAVWDEESSDDERKMGFISATKYSGAPTQKMIKRAAKEQQQKLAALKNWKHIDCSTPDKFTSVDDSVLYKIIWATHDHSSFSSPSADASAGASPSKDSDDGDDIPIIDMEADEDDSGFINLTTKKRRLDPNPPAEDEDDDSDLEFREAPRAKSRSTSASSDSGAKAKKGEKDGGKKRKRAFRSVDPEEKRFNLRNIASSGGTGRVMFIFEKVTDSKFSPAPA